MALFAAVFPIRKAELFLPFLYLFFAEGAIDCLFKPLDLAEAVRAVRGALMAAGLVHPYAPPAAAARAGNGFGLLAVIAGYAVHVARIVAAVIFVNGDPAVKAIYHLRTGFSICRRLESVKIYFGKFYVGDAAALHKCQHELLAHEMRNGYVPFKGFARCLPVFFAHAQQGLGTLVFAAYAAGVYAHVLRREEMFAANAPACAQVLKAGKAHFQEFVVLGEVVQKRGKSHGFFIAENFFSGFFAQIKHLAWGEAKKRWGNKSPKAPLAQVGYFALVAFKYTVVFQFHFTPLF